MNGIYKKTLGQYYTTNYSYILTNINIPSYVYNIIEPFTGNGDLIKFIKEQEIYNNKSYDIECYDIDPKNDYTIKQDTIETHPDYKGKYLITNPPYLARNKSNNKKLFNKYDVNDLYKCIIKEIVSNTCIGGILIIPLNFWSSIRISDIKLRKMFLEKYYVSLLNIFEEQVFDDTTYTICSFQFELKKDTNNELNIMIYPSKINMKIELNENNNYMIGGDIYNLKTNGLYKITRLTSKNKNIKSTNVLVKCIDDNTNNMINMSYVEDDKIYIDNTPNYSSRTYASLIIEPYIDKQKQIQLIMKCNNFLNEYRKKYHSLFLANYRESKDIARKRISFDLIYLIVSYILENFDTAE